MFRTHKRAGKAKANPAAKNKEAAPHWTTGVSAVLKKETVIRVRWPFVIMCSYLLLYSTGGRVAPAEVHALLLFYLMTNATLYFVEDKLLNSPYFYGPLLFLDTLFLTVSIALSGYMVPDFYLACFSTILLCCICHDFRGLVLITILAPVLYGCYLFQSNQLNDPSGFLRIPFPFVIALFYGYFAQVERSERALKEKIEQEAERRRAAERIRNQRECQAALYEISLAITSTLDLQTVLDVLLEKVAFLFPFVAASNVKLFDNKRRLLATVTSRQVAGKEWKNEEWESERDLANVVCETRTPLLVSSAQTDPRTRDRLLFRVHGLVSYLGVPLMGKGALLGVLSLFFDREHQFTNEEVEFLSTLSGQAAIAIHNAQLYENAKTKAEELGKSNKAKDEFLGVMSHELRTPLNIILGYGGMMAKGMLGDISPEQEKALQKINKQSTDMLEMMSGIMAATRVEVGAAVADCKEVDLARLLAEIKSLYGIPLDKTIALKWDYPSHLPVIRTDPGKMRHILQNLINNAIKFTEVGHVRVSVRYSRKLASVEFQVADTGIGIPKEFFTKVFGMFQQGEGPKTSKNDGVGLGLYIVKKFTDLLGGKIEIESAVGRGSTFKVTIPAEISTLSEEESSPLPTAV